MRAYGFIVVDREGMAHLQRYILLWKLSVRDIFLLSSAISLSMVLLFFVYLGSEDATLRYISIIYSSARPSACYWTTESPPFHLMRYIPSRRMEYLREEIKLYYTDYSAVSLLSYIELLLVIGYRFRWREEK